MVGKSVERSDGRSPDLPGTPDFDVYPIAETITGADTDGGGGVVRVEWSDGKTSRFHALWLRENAADAQTINLDTRESIFDLAAAPDDLHVASVSVDGAGALAVRFEPEGHETAYHPGWLQAHDASIGSADAPDPVAHHFWQAADLPEPPTFDGANILTDDGVLEDWLGALAKYGLARLRNVTSEPGMVGQVAGRIGTVRNSNFGTVFDVRARPDPDSNAYTSLALAGHTDLPTREYQPGLQFLHCMENTTSGGRAVYVDGFAVAEAIRQSDDDAFAALTTIPWTYTNRARDSDYRWRSPAVVLAPNSGYREVRIGGFLRGPLDAAFDDVPRAYRALKLYSKLATEPEFQQVFAYQPGDLVAFDNRRILHGREAFDAGGGGRWLQGCYGEREELHSRLRVLARNRRAGGKVDHT